MVMFLIKAIKSLQILKEEVLLIHLALSILYSFLNDRYRTQFVNFQVVVSKRSNLLFQ